MIAVDSSERDMVKVKYSFLAFVAAATAIAADTPQTDVAAAIRIVSVLSSLRIDVPYLYMRYKTRGVTPQARIRP